VFAIGIAEGLASFAGRSSPVTKVAGLGFGGVPAAADLEWLEGAYAVGCDTYVDRMRRTIGGLSRLPGGGAAGHGPRHVARGGARSIRRWRSA
jgi:hypothetical protein